MTLEQFKAAFLAGRPRFADWTEHRSLGGRSSTVVQREGRFQVERVVWPAGLFVPAHKHPSIDGIVMPVSGSMVLLVGDEEEKTNVLLRRARVWSADSLRKRPTRVPAGAWHGGKAGEHGAVFWNFEYWLPGVEMTAAGVDWVGPEKPAYATNG